MLGRFSRYFWLISSLLASTEANLLKTQGPTTLVGLLFTPRPHTRPALCPCRRTNTSRWGSHHGKPAGLGCWPQTVLEEAGPPDVSGVTDISSVLITPDGNNYVYEYGRTLSDLYLVNDLK